MHIQNAAWMATHTHTFDKSNTDASKDYVTLTPPLSVYLSQAVTTMSACWSQECTQQHSSSSNGHWKQTEVNWVGKTPKFSLEMWQSSTENIKSLKRGFEKVCLWYFCLSHKCLSFWQLSSPFAQIYYWKIVTFSTLNTVDCWCLMMNGCHKFSFVAKQVPSFHCFSSPAMNN